MTAIVTPIALTMKCRPKKDTKHLYHKCEDGSGPVDLGLIVKKDLEWPNANDSCYTTVDAEGRIWDVTVLDRECVVEKYPPRSMAKRKRKPRY